MPVPLQDDFDDLCEAIDNHLGPPGVIVPHLPPRNSQDESEEKDARKQSTDSLGACTSAAALAMDERLAERAERAALAAELKNLAQETGRLRCGLDRLLELTEATHSRPSQGSGPNSDQVCYVCKNCNARGAGGNCTTRLAESDRLVQEQLLSAMHVLLREIRAGANLHHPAATLARVDGTSEKQLSSGRTCLAAADEVPMTAPAAPAPDEQAFGSTWELYSSVLGLSFCDQVAVVRPATRSDQLSMHLGPAVESGGIASLLTRRTSGVGLPPPSSQQQSQRSSITVIQSCSRREPSPASPAPSRGTPDGRGLIGNGLPQSMQKQDTIGTVGDSRAGQVGQGRMGGGSSARETLRGALLSHRLGSAGAGLGSAREFLYAHRDPTAGLDSSFAAGGTGPQERGQGLSQRRSLLPSPPPSSSACSSPSPS
jgi:hypothetical protein